MCWKRFFAFVSCCIFVEINENYCVFVVMIMSYWGIARDADISTIKLYIYTDVYHINRFEQLKIISTASWWSSVTVRNNQICSMNFWPESHLFSYWLTALMQCDCLGTFFHGYNKSLSCCLCRFYFYMKCSFCSWVATLKTQVHLHKELQCLNQAAHWKDTTGLRV